MTVGEIYAIPLNGDGWRVLPSGDWVKLGDGVKLGDWVTLGNGVTLDSSPLAVQGTKHLAVNGEVGKIQIGCHVKTFAQWKRHYKKIGEVEGYSSAQIEEYGKIIEFIIANGRG